MTNPPLVRLMLFHEGIVGFDLARDGMGHGKWDGVKFHRYSESSQILAALEDSALINK
jgi:hypothetical protein